MRRRIINVALGTAAALLTCDAVGAVDRSHIEKRLLGTWRSDKERTIANWKYKKELAPEVKERFERIFGKFTLRFTEKYIFTEFDDTKTTAPYLVVAQDSTSVVIEWHEEKGRSLQQIHFEDDGYYVLSGYNVEFYKRIA